MPRLPVVLSRQSRRLGRTLGRLLAVAATLFAAPGARADTPPPDTPEPPAATVIVVGLTSAERRFVPAEQAGTIGQYEAALSVEVARTQGLRVAFQLAPFEELLRDLAAGRIDTIPGMARTPERLQTFDFTVAHNRMNTNLFVRRGEKRIASVAGLPGKRILVVGGSYSQAWAEARGFGTRRSANSNRARPIA